MTLAEWMLAAGLGVVGAVLQAWVAFSRHPPAPSVSRAVVGLVAGLLGGLLAAPAMRYGTGVGAGLAIAAGYLLSDLAASLAARRRAAQAPEASPSAERPPAEPPAESPDVTLSFEDERRDGAAAQHDPRAVGLLYATTRAAVPPDSEGWFSGERADRLAFGRAFVRIPESHRLGKVEQPMKIRLLSRTLYEGRRDPRKHFVLRAVEPMTEDAWRSFVGRFPADEALMFVHGFNTSFEEALFRHAQILWDLKYKGIGVVFSWPSRGSAAAYAYDRNSALGAREAFIRTLQTLKRQPNVRRIHVLAHSMGNLVVMDALATHRHDLEPLGLGEVMLAAPDVDLDHFLGIARKVREAASGMTLYASSADRALFLSKQLAGSVPRAGDVPPGGPVRVPGMDSIDVTALGDEILGLNHGTFATHSILNDVKLVMTGARPPDSRLVEIRPVPEDASQPQYWRYMA